MEHREKKHYHRGRRKRKERKMSDVVNSIILVIAITVFLFATVMLIKSLLPYVQGKSGYKKIQELAIHNHNKNGDEEPTAFTVDFDELLKLNPDTVAWIRFDEPSIINYPVVQGRDNSQYLSQSFTADDNKLGAIFVNVDNKGDFSDRETIIYGHNMHYGGDMFTKLIEYEQSSFCKEHPYFYLYTPDGKMSTYQVFAAEYVEEDSDIYNIEFSDDAAYEDRLNLIKMNSLYQTDIQVKAQDQIVVLSTCTNFAKDQRFLLNGVKIREEDVKSE